MVLLITSNYLSLMDDLRVMILDDEMVIARDLQKILRKMGFSGVKIANSSDEALDLYLPFKPHLILCDINLEEPDKDGIYVCQQIIQQLQTHIIFITAHSDGTYLERASKIKPLNYLLKPFDEEQVVATVRMALAKPEVQKSGYLKQNFSDLLTKTEFKILKLISEDKTSKEIAGLHFISPKTVENHRSNITRKLGLPPKNNSLLSWALEHKELL